MRNLHLKDVSSWCPSRKFISCTQEDQVVIDYFNRKTNGFLLDISASDGVTGSNSFRLINEYDWSGLLVEPCPRHKSNLEILYSDIDDIDVFYGAISGGEDHLIFHELQSDAVGMSYTAERSHGNPKNCPFPIIGTYKVPAIGINKLLEKYNVPSQIDFFSLDIEGAELEVLNYIDMSKYNIELWCIELDDSSIILYGDDVYDKFFIDNGYEKLDISGYHIARENIFWVKK
jgi:FkbM family methyltransferase